MNTPTIHFVSFALLLLGALSARADVTDTLTQRQLSLPGSTWRLVLPKEDWVITKEQRRPGDTAVYYALASQKRELAFSVYIDRTTACNSSAGCLNAAMNNPSYKDARELKKTEVGQFSVASFFLDEPQGYPVKQAHLLAEAYLDGCWFDIHISKTAKDRPDAATLFELLKSVTVSVNER